MTRLRRSAAACALLLMLVPASAAATTYYVSHTGSDARDGTSPATAWRTINRVSIHDFNPGDQILFEGGYTFDGNLYFDAADAGTAAAPVTVASYGQGRATLWAGNGRGILVHNAAGFRIRDLYIFGSGRDVNTESGILFYTDLPGDVLLDGIEIRNVDVLRFHDYGIEIGSNVGRSGYRNVTITNVIARENGMGGIFTYAQQRAVHRNVYVGYSQAFLNAGFPGLLYNSGNGITLSGVDGGRIERCVAFENGWRSDAGNGPVGIWTFNSNNVVIQHNESYNNKTGGTKDGGGFSLDNSTSNSVLQYNYSHDNAGSGFMLAHKWDDYVHTGNVIRWNVTQNDAKKNRYGSIQTWGRIRNAEIYNNTIYVTYAHGGQRAIYLRNSSIEAQDPEHLHFRNNIVQTRSGVPLVDAASSVLDGATDVRFEGNVYWPTGGTFRIYWRGVVYSSLSAWRDATGQERLNGAATGLSVDPQLMAPGGGTSLGHALLTEGLWQYRLKSTSPLIDAGLDLSRFGINIGARDYFGGASVRHFGRDIGAHEFYVSCNWTLTPTGATAAASGGSGDIAVWAAADDCGWGVQPQMSWVTVSTGHGSGQGTVRWRVPPNSGSARSGTIRIADRTFALRQDGSGASTLPSGWAGDDVGAVGLSGSGSSDGTTWTIEGAGADIWGSADAFYYAYRQVDGDWEIEARVATVENVHAWTKAGVMIRGSLEAGSAHGAMMVTPGKGFAFQYRPQAGGLTSSIAGGAGTAPHWVKIARRGSTISAYRRAPSAGSWTHVGDASISLGSSVYVGLFVSSHDASRLATATFDGVAVRLVDAAPPPAPLPSGWASRDIGAVAAAGSAGFNSGAFTVKGAGADIWGAADEFHFAYSTLTGDGQIVARVAAVQNTNAWAKAAVMMRETLTAGSKHAAMMVTPGKGLAFQRRVSTAGPTTHTAGELAAAPRWVKLVRSGATITAYSSADGAAWTAIGSDTINMAATIHVGLAVSSHVDGTLCAATFDNVVVGPLP